MNYDDLQKAWQSQGNPPKLNIDPAMLLKEVQRNKSNFKSMVFWRDVREVGVAAVIAVFFLCCVIADPNLWPLALIAAGCLWIAGFMLVDRWRQRRHKPQSADPLRSCAQASVLEVDHQIWLLRNVLWWYLLPPGIGGTVFIGYLAGQVRSAEILWPKPFVAEFALFSGLLSLGVYHLNQWAVNRHLRPRRQELQDLLDSLPAPNPQDFPLKSPAAPPRQWPSSARWFHHACLGALVLAPVLMATVSWMGGCNTWAVPSTQPAWYPSAVQLPGATPTSHLQIIKARYGVWNSWIDVTANLNQCIHDGHREFWVGNDIAGDPFFGLRKRLELEYILDDHPGQISIKEGDYLCLPSTAPPK
jgi:hypothetical protein